MQRLLLEPVFQSANIFSCLCAFLPEFALQFEDLFLVIILQYQRSRFCLLKLSRHSGHAFLKQGLFVLQQVQRTGLYGHLPALVAAHLLQCRNFFGLHFKCQPRTQHGENLAQGRRLGLRGGKKAGHGRVHVIAHSEYAKAMPVEKFKGRILVFEFRPELEDAEIPLAYISVVKDDNRPLAELGEPRFKIMLHILVEMTPVNVRQIDGPIAEMLQSRIKACGDQP